MEISGGAGGMEPDIREVVSLVAAVGFFFFFNNFIILIDFQVQTCSSAC